MPKFKKDDIVSIDDGDFVIRIMLVEDEDYKYYYVFNKRHPKYVGTSSWGEVDFIDATGVLFNKIQFTKLWREINS